ncbi:MAG: 3'-5' exonuclease [Candidatus Saccharibacteria bacterium]
MKFKKDILMIDFETTDGRPTYAKPIQLAAILLDKDTLKEKQDFSSYIWQDLSKADPRSLQIHGITQDNLKDAPDQKEVMQRFLDHFGTDIFLSCWTTLLDARMLEDMLAAIGKDFMTYDYHILDVWAIAYTELVKQGKGNISNSVHTFAEFGLPPRGHHDALEDCRHAAEVLRKIML